MNMISGAGQRVARRLDTRNMEVAKVLSTPGGKVLLEALEQEFIWGPLIGADDRQLYFNLGARDVVLYLLDLMHNAERQLGG